MELASPFPHRLLFETFCIGMLLSLEASAATWTGESESPSWNTKENWLEQAVPPVSKSSTILFDSPAGASFAFGGNAPLSFGSFTASTNSGPVSIRAPGFHLGGSANDEPDVGFILEDIVFPALIENKSTNAFSLVSDVSSQKQLALKASSVPVDITGNINVNGPLTLDGPVILRSSTINADRIEHKRGVLELDGTSLSITNETYGSRDAKQPKIGYRLTAGSSLSFEPQKTDGPIYVYCPIELENATFRSSAKEVFFLDEMPVIGNQTTFEVAGLLRLIDPYANATNRTAVSIGQGSVISCGAFSLGGNPRFGWPRQNAPCSYMDLILEGCDPKAPDADAKRISWTAKQGSFAIGGGFDQNSSSKMRLFASGNVLIDVAETFAVPLGGNGSALNSAILSNGVQVVCKNFSVGSSGISNTVLVSRARLKTGDGHLAVGNVGSWKFQGGVFNRFIVADRSDVGGFDTSVILGNSRFNDRNNEAAVCHDNEILVSGRSRFRSSHVNVGQGSLLVPTHDNRIVVSGAETRWESNEGDFHVGFADGGRSFENTVVIRDGATLAGVRDLRVGSVSEKGGRAKENKLLVMGANISTKGHVAVGYFPRTNAPSVAETNLLVVAAHNNVPTVWDFNGGDLLVGFGLADNQKTSGNVFRGGPGAKLKKIKKIAIGGNARADTYKNPLSLEGCEIDPIETLSIAPNNTLSVTINPEFGPLGTKPLRVTGDVVVDYDAFILPVAAKGVKPGKYPILAWKGKGPNAKQVKLSKEANQKRWKLIVDETKKHILVECLW